jgi:hypothetical protein
VVIDRDQDRLRRRPARTHHNNMTRPHGTRWPEEFRPRSSGLFVRRRRAGRPQRSEDRTGPATSGGGRRPHLTNEEKVLTDKDARHPSRPAVDRTTPTFSSPNDAPWFAMAGGVSCGLRGGEFW